MSFAYVPVWEYSTSSVLAPQPQHNTSLLPAVPLLPRRPIPSRPPTIRPNQNNLQPSRLENRSLNLQSATTPKLQTRRTHSCVPLFPVYFRHILTANYPATHIKCSVTPIRCAGVVETTGKLSSKISAGEMSVSWKRRRWYRTNRRAVTRVMTVGGQGGKTMSISRTTYKNTNISWDARSILSWGDHETT